MLSTWHTHILTYTLLCGFRYCWWFNLIGNVLFQAEMGHMSKRQNVPIIAFKVYGKKPGFLHPVHVRQDRLTESVRQSEILLRRTNGPTIWTFFAQFFVRSDVLFDKSTQIRTEYRTGRRIGQKFSRVNTLLRPASGPGLGLAYSCLSKHRQPCRLAYTFHLFTRALTSHVNVIAE